MSFFTEVSVQNPWHVSVQKLQWVKGISGCVGFIFLILNNYVKNSGAFDKTLQIQVIFKTFSNSNLQRVFLGAMISQVVSLEQYISYYGLVKLFFFFF